MKVIHFCNTSGNVLQLLHKWVRPLEVQGIFVYALTSLDEVEKSYRAIVLVDFRWNKTSQLWFLDKKGPILLQAVTPSPSHRGLWMMPARRAGCQLAIFVTFGTVTQHPQVWCAGWRHSKAGSCSNGLVPPSQHSSTDSTHQVTPALCLSLCCLLLFSHTSPEAADCFLLPIMFCRVWGFLYYYFL